MGAVETFDLRREFRTGGLRRGETVVALRDISLQVEEGEFHGLLRPNGAGKTTLIKILSTILLPTSGRAEIFGYDVTESTKIVRKLFGLVFGGDRGLYTRLTARQNLDYWAALYEVPAQEAKETVESLIHLVGLDERADHRVETRLWLAWGGLRSPCSASGSFRRVDVATGLSTSRSSQRINRTWSWAAPRAPRRCRHRPSRCRSTPGRRSSGTREAGRRTPTRCPRGSRRPR